MGCDGRGRARQSEARRSARSLQHRQRGVGGQRLPLGPDRGEPEGEGLAEPSPPARRTQSSAVRAPEVGEHDALEGARPCRARIRPAAELDGRQDRAHHRHRASEIQDRHDEPRLQHPQAGSARAGGSCTRLSALTGGLRVASCKGPRGRRPGVKTVPDRGLTSARALQPLPKASIVRGSLYSKNIGSTIPTKLTTGAKNCCKARHENSNPEYLLPVPLCLGSISRWGRGEGRDRCKSGPSKSICKATISRDTEAFKTRVRSRV